MACFRLVLSAQQKKLLEIAADYADTDWRELIEWIVTEHNGMPMDVLEATNGDIYLGVIDQRDVLELDFDALLSEREPEEALASDDEEDGSSLEEFLWLTDLGHSGVFH